MLSRSFSLTKFAVSQQDLARCLNKVTSSLRFPFPILSVPTLNCDDLLSQRFVQSFVPPSELAQGFLRCGYYLVFYFRFVIAELQDAIRRTNQLLNGDAEEGCKLLEVAESRLGIAAHVSRDCALRKADLVSQLILADPGPLHEVAESLRERIHFLIKSPCHVLENEY